jgi:hypothetical protein
LTLPQDQPFATFGEIGETDRCGTEGTMTDAQIGQRGPSTGVAAGEHGQPTRTTRALGLGAVAFGAFALGATAIGALVIGRLAVGAFALKRGHVRTLRVDNLEVRRLHIGELTIDSGVPR